MSEDASPEPGTGYYLYGVVRAGGWRLRPQSAPAERLARIRLRTLEALVRQVPFDLPPLDQAGLLAHQRTVEQAMRRATILPAPYGVVFQGRRPLLRFLDDQYAVLEEALDFVDGHWELRLHVSPAAALEPSAVLADQAVQVFTELRRHARAAVPFPREGRRLLTAAFLVERTAWVDFVERAEDLGTAHPELAFDVTGPWPPYDFVRMAP